MRIGVPKEIKTHEYRVGMTPAAVGELTGRGHSVVVETRAGVGVDYIDQHYIDAGATIVSEANEVFEGVDLIVKVKEPQLHECAWLKPHQALFTFLHLAADRPQADALQESGATCIAYETVTDSRGGLPLLRPMSEVAGRMSIQVGAHYLEKAHGGCGVLLGGVPGVEPAKVVILGAGVSGIQAAEMAVGLRAETIIFDISTSRLADVDLAFGGRVKTAFATKAAIGAAIAGAHLVVGAVLIPGASAPRLVTRDMLGTMRLGAVLVDIAIDQGGCFETSRPTTHAEPTFTIDGIVHYCVANMPGAVARTSTEALNNATLPFVIALAEKGVEGALSADPHLRAGLNVSGGQIRHEAVAHALK